MQKNIKEEKKYDKIYNNYYIFYHIFNLCIDIIKIAKLSE